MRAQFSFLYFVLFLLALSSLAVLVQFGVVTLTFHKLGLSAGSAFLLLFTSLLGSFVNFPLFRLQVESPGIEVESFLLGHLRLAPAMRRGSTVIAVNLGGCIIPVLFSLYLLFRAGPGIVPVLSGVAFVTAVSYLSSRPVAGVGIGIPILVAPLAAAVISILAGGEERAALAYISGTLGVLFGADLLRLRDVRKFESTVASIGGAGTFDGIFLTGFVAVLLT